MRGQHLRRALSSDHRAKTDFTIDAGVSAKDGNKPLYSSCVSCWDCVPIPLAASSGVISADSGGDQRAGPSAMQA